jgi:hypothetical protein
MPYTYHTTTGDAVLDRARGCTILSGDAIMQRLAQDLRPSTVGFITDVAGIYDRPPHKAVAVEDTTDVTQRQAPARLLPELWVRPCGNSNERACNVLQQASLHPSIPPSLRVGRGFR